MISKKTVTIAFMGGSSSYPGELPFRPHEVYPELREHVPTGNERNAMYPLLRQLMQNLKMDIEHFSTPNWNPFGEIIRPGHKVLVKPNLVRHINLAGGDYQTVVTHGSLVRSVLDYVALALQGNGELTIGDAPVQSADFSKILERTGLQEVCDDVTKTWQIPVKLVDFRLSSLELDDNHRVIRSDALKGDLAGYLAVNLGKRSLLAPLGEQSEKFRVTNYDCREMKKHHNETRHEYLIPRTVLNADVVINLPKLKTHRKVGLTAALKNMVGINGHKDWLPHHRCGCVEEGGDEYLYASFLKRLQSRLGERIDQIPNCRSNFFRRMGIYVAGRMARLLADDPFEEGSWYGNDTIWRTVLDLNRLVLYADRRGKMSETPQRKCLTIVDAIIAGDGEGPMSPDSKPCGALVGGSNPVAVDAVLATLVGFDYRKIPIIKKGFEVKVWPIVEFGPGDIIVCSKNAELHSFKVGISGNKFCFKPASGWLHHIELPRCSLVS